MKLELNYTHKSAMTHAGNFLPPDLTFDFWIQNKWVF